MKIEELVEILNLAWDETGCLGKLRQGEFDAPQLERLVVDLTTVSLPDSDQALDREFVRLLWFLPLFMTWQTERVKEKGEDTQCLEVLINKFTDALLLILGTP